MNLRDFFNNNLSEILVMSDKHAEIPNSLKEEFSKAIQVAAIPDERKQKYQAMLKQIKQMQQYKSLVLELNQEIQEIEENENLTDEEKLEPDARTQAERISKGIDENHFLGKMSYAVISQNITALKQTQPAFRNAKWHRRYKEVEQEILKQFQKKPHRELKAFMHKLQQVKAGNEQ